MLLAASYSEIHTINMEYFLSKSHQMVVYLPQIKRRGAEESVEVEREKEI